MPDATTNAYRIHGYEHLDTLVDDLYWVRDRVLDAVARLSEGEFRSRETARRYRGRMTCGHGSGNCLMGTSPPGQPETATSCPFGSTAPTW